MAAPQPIPRPWTRADEALAQSIVFRAVLRFAWRILGRYGLSGADRDDVAQDVAITAYLRRATYCPKRGNLEQWLSGIARNEMRSFRRQQRRQPVLAAGDVPCGAESQAPTPEESVVSIDLAEHVLEFLPAPERRVVILRDIEGLSNRKIAEIEKISASTVSERYQRGMARLRPAAAEEKAGLLPLPIAFVTALGPDADTSEPPPELMERAWRRMAKELGLEGPAESEAPPSGTRHVDPTRDGNRPPSIRPPRGVSGVARRFGPLLMLFLGAGPPQERPGDPHPDERPATVLAATPAISSRVEDGTKGAAPGPASAAPEPASTAPEPAPTWSIATIATSIPGRASPPQGTRGASRPDTGSDRLDAEHAVIDNARWAVTADKWALALTALAQHAQQFPNGRHAPLRERLWAQVCERYRQASQPIGAPEIGKSCAGR